MSDEELISPITMDGYSLQATQQSTPTFNFLHMQPIIQLPGSDALTTSDGPATNVTISRAGQSYSELQLLQSQNPDQYKQVLTGIINTLNAAMPNATEAEQQLLSQYLDLFQQTGNGDISALQPSPPPINADLLAQSSPLTSDLGNLVALQNQNTNDPNLLTMQEQETSVSTLLSLSTQNAVTISSLLAPQQLPTTFGDLFLQTNTPVNMHGVVAVYGPHNQLLTEAYSSQETPTYQTSFSASTQQALNSISNALHSALFGVSAAASTSSASDS